MPARPPDRSTARPCSTGLTLCLQVCLPGDWLIRRGEVGREMYLVRRGKLRIYTADRTIDVGPGSYVGEVAVLYEQKRCALRWASSVPLGLIEAARPRAVLLTCRP